MTSCRVRVGRHFAIIDASNFEIISSFKWYCAAGYAISYEKTGSPRKKISMHRMVLNCGPGQLCDHINGNRLDNRLENIRLCSPAENARNRKIQSNNKSGFKGIYWESAEKVFRAEICHGNKKYRLGRFKRRVDAARAYNEAAKRFHGEFAKVNDLGAHS